MKTKFTKKERNAIYRKMLAEIESCVGDNYFICLRLARYMDIDYLGSHDDRPLSAFPEFKKVLLAANKTYNIFDKNSERRTALKKCIKLTTTKAVK